MQSIYINNTTLRYTHKYKVHRITKPLYLKSILHTASLMADLDL